MLNGRTVSVAEPLTLPTRAVMATVEFASTTAMPPPGLVTSLLICASELEELHVTAPSCCVLPSRKVPTAINFCVESVERVTDWGVMLMDSNSGGANVSGAAGPRAFSGEVFHEGDVRAYVNGFEIGAKI